MSGQVLTVNNLLPPGLYIQGREAGWLMLRQTKLPSVPQDGHVTRNHRRLLTRHLSHPPCFWRPGTGHTPTWALVPPIHAAEPAAS